MRSWASHRKPGDQAREAQLLEASLCLACWVGQLPLSVVLQLAHERELLGGGADPRATWLRMHDQVPAILSDHRPRWPPQTSQPDPENETASLGGALLRFASALEQKHDSGGTVHDAFGQNPGVANSQEEEYDAIFGDQSSRECSGLARLGGQALTERVVRTRKERPKVVVASRESRVRKDLTVLDGEAWSWRRHADVCLLPGCGNFRGLKRFVAMTAAALDEGKSGNLQRQNALLHHITLFWNRRPKIHPTKRSGDGPSWASRTQRAVSCPLGLPQSRVAYHKERVALDAARKSWEPLHRSASVAAHFEKEIQAEFDRRNAKGGKRTGGKKGAQGEG